MNRDDLNRMASEAGLGGVENWQAVDALIQAAYAAGAAEEREACAKAVEDAKEWKGGGWVSTLSPETKKAIAAAIRARGQA